MNKLDSCLKELKQELEAIKTYQEFAAELMGNYYRALLKGGFSVPQALQIVIAHGTLPPYKPACTSCSNYDFDVDIYDFFDDDGSTDLI